VLVPKLVQSARDDPDVVLDVTTDESRVDLAAGFDAGIHFGEFIEQDMVAVRVARDSARLSSARRPIFRVASQTQIAARSARPPMHQLSAWL